MRGSGRRIWADLPRRTTKPDSRTALARMAAQAPFYIFAAFVFTYGTTVLRSSRDLLLTALLSATILSFVMVPLSGYLSAGPRRGRAGRWNLKIGAGALRWRGFGTIYPR